MCGLVGVMGRMTVQIEHAFEDMLQFDVVRGAHSTGVAFVRRGGAHALIKAAVLPQDIIDSMDYAKEMKLHNLGLIGHNRFATKGLINDANAHPFMHGDIIGTHNGTLHGQDKLIDSEFFDSDSDNLFHSINEEGIEKTWACVHGAAAVVYFDGKDNTLNMIKNEHRPLYLALTKDKKTVFWASESWMIKIAAERHKIEIGRVYRPKDNQLFSLSFPHNGDIENKAEKLSPFVPPQSYNHRRAANQTGARRIAVAEDPKGPPVLIQGPSCPLPKPQDTAPFQGGSGKPSTGTPTIPPTTSSISEDGLTHPTRALLQKNREAHAEEARKAAEDERAAKNGTNIIPITAARSTDTMPVPKINPAPTVKQDNTVRPVLKLRKPTRREIAAARKIEKDRKKAEQALKRKSRADKKGVEWREGYEGDVLTKQQFDNQYTNCYGCPNTLEYVDPNIEFISETEAFCSNCSTIMHEAGMNISNLKN